MAGAAAAQTSGLRQLSWPGRAAAPASAPSSTGARTDLRRPNLVIPHGGFAAVQPAAERAEPAAPAPRRTLTPASAWLRPAAPPAAQPVAEAPPPDAPPPAAPVRAAPAPPPPLAQPQPRQPVPEYLPDQGGRGQPVPADAVWPAQPEPAPRVAESVAATIDPADPMAPRRDAPIFRMQQRNLAQPAPEAAPDAEDAAQPAASDEPRPQRVAEVSNTGERPPQQGARYYSVHRQNGRTPDGLSMPEPTYVDSLAITMTQTPASQDLAQPDQGPTLIRDNQGRVRQAPAPSDGDHQ